LETEAGLVLVDTGVGTLDVTAPLPRLSRFFVSLLRPRLDMEETALRQIQRLGFSPADVRHIILTHLDFDHAGGITDFPEATVHLLGAELDAARQRRTSIERARYRPLQWPPPSSWQPYSADGEAWFGFDSVRALDGLPPEILLVPLAGHTPGHCGVAIRTTDSWLLHAGDAYFYRGEMDPQDPSCPLGLRAYQTMMEVDRKARLMNQRRLRELVRTHSRSVQVFCAHDHVEFEAFAIREHSAESGVAVSEASA
jgi:glyoxylase-like metal-dependent hydrolase (beta-lactamase superfamily II)